MTVVKVQNWQQMEKRAREKVHASAGNLVRARVKKVFDLAVKVSPQWSGNYAANWAIETNHAEVGKAAYNPGLKETPWQNLQWWDTGVDSSNAERKSFASGAYDGKPMAKYAGAARAVEQAKLRNYDAIATIKWNTKVRLVNMAPVSALLDAGAVNLRRVNLIPEHVGVLSFIKAKYPNILE